MSPTCLWFFCPLLPKFILKISPDRLGKKYILSSSADSACGFQPLTGANTGDCSLFHSILFSFVYTRLFSHLFWTFHLRLLPRFLLLMLLKCECSWKGNPGSTVFLFQTFLECPYPSINRSTTCMQLVLKFVSLDISFSLSTRPCFHAECFS